MGQCLVIYDIPADGVRAKVADACLDYGLDRIQYSAYLGSIQNTHLEELVLRCQKLLGKHNGSIHFYPLCEVDWNKRTVLVQGEVGERV